MARKDSFKGMSKDFENSALADKFATASVKEENLNVPNTDSQTDAVEEQEKPAVKEIEVKVTAQEPDVADEVIEQAVEETQNDIDLAGLPTVNGEEEIDETVKRPKKTSAKKKATAVNFFAVEETINKTFVIKKEIADTIDNLFIDKNGKRVPGTRGMVGKIANNGLIRELVAAGVLDESYLEKLESYS